MTANPLNPLSPSRYAWCVVALLAPVVLLNYMDRQMMAAMKHSLMGDIIGLDSEAKWGLLPAAFKWTYAALSPLGGCIADRFSKKHVIVLSLFVWSAITWATGHAQTFEQLLWSRALMGVSEAFYFPAALALIMDYHTGPTRSRAAGIHQMALYVGVMIGGFSGYAADAPDLGWRWAFDTAGIVGVCYAVPLFFLLKNARPDFVASKPAPERGTRLSVGRAFGALLSNKYFIMMVVYFTLPGLAGWVVKDWMPAILKEQFDIGQGKAGVSAAFYVSVASILGVVLGGWLADRRMRHTERGRIQIGFLGVCCAIPALFGVGNAGALPVAVAFLILFGIGWGFFDCNHMPILCQIVRPELRATGYGIMNFVAISCGGFTDWGVGVMRDGGLPNNVIFAVFASLCALAAVIACLIKPDRSLS
ncbi:MAG: MFS transporter [Opitutaceae bacterium]|jgi:MFS family permease|nr:MFS transporter [Opitutaceae bacterium]